MAETELLKMASGGGEDDEENASFNPANEEPCDFIFEHDDYDIPKPIEGLRDVGLPPFLRKTYEMVDDPSTDSIISWGPAKTSFVVWDPHRFSTELLPAHFKHRNFSSFVRQLNTYCFRKIDSDRWEFANYGFQYGKKQLLNCIKRQKPNSQVTRRRHVTTNQKGCLNNTGHGMEAQLEKLKNEHSVLQVEVLKLRQQHENTLLHLDSVKARLHTTETKQKRMALFLVKFLKNPVFLHYMSEKVGKMRDGKLKKRRLANVEVEEAKKATDSDEIANMSIIDDDSDGKTMVVSCDESCSAWEQKKTEENCPHVTNHSDASSEKFFLWEKLMEEDMIYEDEKQQSDMVMELEDLISSEPAECSVQIRGKVEPVGCLASIS